MLPKKIVKTFGPIFMIEKKNSASKTGGRLYSRFSNSNYWYERTKRVLNDPQQLLMLIYYGCPKHGGWVSGYIKTKIQTFSPISSKESLKWSLESTLDNHWCLHPFFKLKHWGSRFCLSGKTWCSIKVWMGIMNISITISWPKKGCEMAWNNPQDHNQGSSQPMFFYKIMV